MLDRPPIHRTASLVAFMALMLAACAAGSAPSSATGSAIATATPTATATADESQPGRSSATPSAECINPPPDLVTLINQTDPAACYGATPITVEAEVVNVGVIDCAPIEPAWMGCSEWVALQPIAAQARGGGIVLAETSGPPGLPQMYAAIHPETALEPDQIMGRRLRITGHFDDPAAQTCRQTGLVFDQTTLPPPDSSCRDLFVMTAFEEL